MKINTLRTIIREFTLADASSVLALNGDPIVTQYTADNSPILTLNDAQTVISNIWLHEYALYGYGRWAVLDNTTHKVIGFCGLKYIPEVGLPDIGYRFLPQYWGNGYATESALACTAYCKSELGVSQFFGDVIADNKASIRVLQKLGLKFSGYVKTDSITFQRYLLSTPTLQNTIQFYK
ncbi:GNAT family N-acetyltransferase [Pseudoalteromonas citrea]|nr:GNAT family N-acetyltransferase [Pseudoalteromonas citrea]